MSILEYDNWLYVLTSMFSFIFVQTSLIVIVEWKIPHNSKETIKIYFSKTKDFFYSKSENLETALTESSNLTFIPVVEDQKDKNKFPFKLNTEANHNFQYAVKNFGLDSKCKDAFDSVIKGLTPKNKLIFTKIHKGKFHKKPVVLFFLYYFELLENAEWKMQQSEITDIINDMIDFKTNLKIKRDQTKRIDTYMLSRYKNEKMQ